MEIFLRKNWERPRTVESSIEDALKILQLWKRKPLNYIY